RKTKQRLSSPTVNNFGRTISAAVLCRFKLCFWLTVHFQLHRFQRESESSTSRALRFSAEGMKQLAGVTFGESVADTKCFRFARWAAVGAEEEIHERRDICVVARVALA